MKGDEQYMNDDLLVSYLLNEGDEKTRSVVERWIIETPENARYFDHFKTIWEASKDLKLPATVNENAAWEKFLERTKKDKTANPGKIYSISRLYRIAAAFIIAASLITLGYFSWDMLDRSSVTVASTMETTKRLLPDGSEVVLNKNSSISYTRKLKGRERKIKLQGEAFFQVAHDTEKPFIVDVDQVVITVVGTSFNVKSYEGTTEIIVESGKVKVDSKGKSILLGPGESVTIGGNDSLVQQTSRDKLYNYYVTKEFVCDNTPLWKLVDVLNEAYNVNIEITNPDIRQLPLTTTFQNESLDNILKVIVETFDITITREGDRILMK